MPCVGHFPILDQVKDGELICPLKLPRQGGLWLILDLAHTIDHCVSSQQICAVESILSELVETEYFMEVLNRCNTETVKYVADFLIWYNTIV